MRGGLLQLRPAAGEREQLVGGGWAPFLRHCLGGLCCLRWRSRELRRRRGWLGLGLGLGLVHRLARGKGGTATPEQLVLRLSGPSRVPALTTIDDTVGPVAAVAGDALRLALDEVAAARKVTQRTRNQHRDESPGHSAPPHAIQVAGERGLIGAPQTALARRRWCGDTVAACSGNSDRYSVAAALLHFMNPISIAKKTSIANQ